MSPNKKNQPQTVPSQSSSPKKYVAVVIIILLIAACGVFAVSNNADAQTYGYEIVNTYPHDSYAFTQGLVMVDGELYEGTGKYGRSQIRKVELKTGKVTASMSLDKNLFGEGITILNGKIYQLTWKSNIGYIYDLKTFKPIKSFKFRGEGWGITNDGTHLIMSNGSSYLQYFEPENFRLVKRVRVRNANGRDLRNLNELEFIKGKIYANVWYRDEIAIIDPKSGRVEAWWDLNSLYRRTDREHVFNGIAYDEKADRIFVTGKNWGKLFEVKMVEKK